MLKPLSLPSPRWGEGTPADVYPGGIDAYAPLPTLSPMGTPANVHPDWERGFRGMAAYAPLPALSPMGRGTPADVYSGGIDAYAPLPALSPMGRGDSGIDA